MASTNRHDIRSAGMSMLVVMVSIGLMGLGMMIYIQYFKGQQQLTQKMTASQDLEGLRNYVRIKLDCLTTTSPVPAGCLSSTMKNVEAKMGSGEVFIFTDEANSKNTVGSYQLRMVCAADGTMYKIIAQYRKGSSGTWNVLFSQTPVCGSFK